VHYLRPKGTLVAVGLPSGTPVLTVPLGLLIIKVIKYLPFDHLERATIFINQLDVSA
jgi:D-arabinose 1-dehydrogenase-like Zn-dependent alcohol dehydrogenase